MKALQEIGKKKKYIMVKNNNKLYTKEINTEILPEDYYRIKFISKNTSRIWEYEGINDEKFYLLFSKKKE